jgi:cytochrome c oxidase cbb3-type subunit I/II
MTTNIMDHSNIEAKIRTMQKLGVPYPEGYDIQAIDDLQSQAQKISSNLKESGIEVLPDTEIIALIAYLQRMGTDIKNASSENQ